MFKLSKILRLTAISIFVLFSFIRVGLANAAEPPSILIIVPHAPDDLEISIWSNDNYVKADISESLTENYYTFYSSELRHSVEYRLKINTKDTEYVILFDEPLQSYNNIYMLDLENQSLTPGKSLARSVKLVSIRIALTLLIEGLVFFYFGYRKKRSWVIFLVTNLLTQGALNIWLNGFTPLASYLIFALIFAEIWVIISEAIVFTVLLKEQRRSQAVKYVLVANVLSLLVGMGLISVV